MPVQKMMRAALAVAFGLCGLAVQADPAAVAGFSFVKSLDGIDEYRLDEYGLDSRQLGFRFRPALPFRAR